eukprot:TRINITY_DN67834_c7_g4_i1.p1 TRINITY_DN67834_c7_g4~~TRINITY_DN67834_c7_g4_i1.p1  ORF type:complete len:623 (+),score=58.69 TRINITY_DN67834_c7_g4_i1:62-1930(+)
MSLAGGFDENATESSLYDHRVASRERSVEKSMERTRDEPSIIPPQYTLSLRAEWDREVRCKLAVKNAAAKLHQMSEFLEKQSPIFEAKLLEALKKRTKTEITFAEANLEDSRNKRDHIAKLLEVLTLKEEVDFVDEFIDELEVFDERQILGPAVLDLGKKHRAESYSMDNIMMAASPIATFNIGARVRCHCKDDIIPWHIYLALETGEVSLWDLQKQKEIKRMPVGIYPLTCLRVGNITGPLTGNKKYLFTSGKDKTVRVWDVMKNEVIDVFVNHTGRVRQLQLRDSVLYSAGYDGAILAWDVKRGRCMTTVWQSRMRPNQFTTLKKKNKGDNKEAETVPNPIHKFLFTKVDGDDTEYIVTGHRDGSVRMMVFDSQVHKVLPANKTRARRKKEAALAGKEDDSDDEDEESEKLTPAHAAAVRCMATHGDFLLTGGDDKIIIQWDLRDRIRTREYRRHVDSVVDVKVSGDGLLFSASQDALIMIWNTIDGSFVRELHHHFHFVSCLDLLCMKPINGTYHSLGSVQEVGAASVHSVDSVAIEGTEKPAGTENNGAEEGSAPPRPPKQLTIEEKLAAEFPWLMGTVTTEPVLTGAKDGTTYLLSASFDKTVALWELWGKDVGTLN